MRFKNISKKIPFNDVITYFIEFLFKKMLYQSIRKYFKFSFKTSKESNPHKINCFSAQNK